MYKLLKDILKILSKKDKVTFILLVIFLFFTTIFEIIGLALILPFLILINNSDLVYTNEFINEIFVLINLDNKYDFLYFIGFLAIFFSFIGAALSIYTNIKLGKYANNIAGAFSVNLIKIYLKETIEGELVDKKIYSKIKRNVISESSVISNNILIPLINIISRSILIVILLIVLGLFNYKITLLIISYLSVFYFIITKYSKNFIQANKLEIEQLKRDKEEYYNTLFSFEEEKEINNDKLLEKYKLSTYRLGNLLSINAVITKLPRYLMMFLVFSSTIAYLLYLITYEKDTVSVIIHTILIFLILGLKILPQLQNIYINYIKLQSNKVSFYDIYHKFKKEN